MLIAVVPSYQSLSRTSGISEDTLQCSEQRNYQRKALAYFPDVSLLPRQPRRGRTQNFAHIDSLRRHYRRMHFQYQAGPLSYPLPSCM